MRKALLVGIDYYENISQLSGCAKDAHSMKAALERHADGTVNFVSPQLLIGTGPQRRVGKHQLKDAIRALFGDDAEIALFYFSGHGSLQDIGGYLCASDTETSDDGLSLSELMSWANRSKARNKIIILDSCHSGVVGSSPIAREIAEVSEGMTILTASTAEQYSVEVAGGAGGVFTNLFVDALNGAAANLVGDVTPGSVYAHIDQSLGPWAQRPVFKTNVKTFVSLRRVDPPISLADLRALRTYFPAPEHHLRLDPSFEPERSASELGDPAVPAPDPTHTAIFAVLQNYARVNLIRPVGAPHMWHAAMRSKSCELTVLGKHYWSLVDKELI